MQASQCTAFVYIFQCTFSHFDSGYQPSKINWICDCFPNPREACRAVSPWGGRVAERGGGRAPSGSSCHAQRTAPASPRDKARRPPAGAVVVILNGAHAMVLWPPACG